MSVIARFTSRESSFYIKLNLALRELDRLLTKTGKLVYDL